MIETRPEPSEPWGCTLADLIALTFGAAVACSLYWYSTKSGATSIGGMLAPTWYVWSGMSLEFLTKCCVALAPVILQRRWRSGLPLRPIDYLPMLMAYGQISNSMWQWPVLALVYKDPNSATGQLVNMDAFLAWKLGNVVVGLFALLLILTRRNQPRDWSFGVFLALGWSCLVYASGQFSQSWGNELITSQGWPVWMVRLASTFGVQAPQGLIANLPMGIVLVDLVHRGERSSSWVDWLVIRVVLPLQFGFLFHFLAWSALARGLALDDALYVFSWLATLGLAYLLARRFEPSWRAFLEGDTVNAASESRY